jgi:hypothetical protein
MNRLKSQALLFSWVCCLFLLGFSCPAPAADERAPNRQPVKAVGDQRLIVTTANGAGALALYASRTLGDGAVHADIERAVLIFHGRLRDADVYWRSAQKALQAAPDAAPQTLLIAPQFLAERDVTAYGIAPETLRWSLEGWEGGDNAVGPAPISSFEAIDSLLNMLADRRRFPRLAQVVLAGHSGGAQVVQRYAVVGQGEAQLQAVGVKVRYVVANPSSYLYFSADRPKEGGLFGPPASQLCPSFDNWKYGWNDAPPYARRLAPAEYESRYVKRDVVYLLGSDDVNPQHPALDKSCAGESQGPYRLARGRSYFSYIQQRHPQLRQPLHIVEGVGHDGDRMLGSACGLAALFDNASSQGACKP